MWRRRKYKIIRKMKTEARGNVFLYNLSMFVTLRVRLADSNPQMLEWRTSVVYLKNHSAAKEKILLVVHFFIVIRGP